MEQLESTNRDLQLTTERMRTVEAQRIAASKEIEMQRMQVGQHVQWINSLYSEPSAPLSIKSGHITPTAVVTT
jgi:hypothetical protein